MQVTAKDQVIPFGQTPEVSDSHVAIVSVKSLIEDALDQAPNTRKYRKLMSRYYRNENFAKRFEEATMEKLNEDSEFSSMLPSVAAAMGDPEEFSAETQFSVAKLDLPKLFDLILEYGPKLAELVINIIKLFQGLSF